MRKLWTVLNRKLTVSPAIDTAWDIFALLVGFLGLMSGIALCIMGSYASPVLVVLSAWLLTRKIRYGFTA
jgi:hypothetical protein